MTSAVCDISVCYRLGRLKVKEAFRTFRDWLAVQLHIPASTFCHCCLNTATVESFPMSLACGPKGHFGKCNGYEDIKSHKNSYKFTIFYSRVRACVCAIQVLWAEQQVVKKRKKRDVYEDPTDPDFYKQWYLVCNRFCNFSRLFSVRAPPVLLLNVLMLRCIHCQGEFIVIDWVYNGLPVFWLSFSFVICWFHLNVKSSYRTLIKISFCYRAFIL